MAEIELSILSRQCLRRRLPAEWILTLQNIAWENARNAAKAKIHRSFTIDLKPVVIYTHNSSLD